ncbi:hypothetical protein AB0I77_13590 [Streptomyces sp. NPDC050619]|uniref:hypothetical protein n=1 Tax=Streptomyces sp. NPDC050619 TaxID=3157214 RepID=UPI0034350ECD
MSADREKHDMTHGDIALLLADATDEVEIGIAPYQAVIRGGRRRRARRWAVAAATALVLAGSSATLAVAGLPGGDGGRAATLATPPAPSAEPDVLTAQRTLLATGTDQGKEWRVYIDVWAAPGDEAEAAGQLEAMGEYGERPVEADQASELVGQSSYFVRRDAGDGEPAGMMEGAFTKTDTMAGTDIQAGAVPLEPGSEGLNRLVVGQVAKTAQRVTCTWKNGTSTDVHVVPHGYDVNNDELVIRPADGSPVNWFVCLAPKGTEYKSVEVTKVK